MWKKIQDCLQTFLLEQPFYIRLGKIIPDFCQITSNSLKMLIPIHISRSQRFF
jgi:hypothetical protein